MSEKASFIFWITLLLYLITLLTVSYVGVYLTYIAIPLIVILGFIMMLSTTKKENNEVINETDVSTPKNDSHLVTPESNVSIPNKKNKNFLNETKSTINEVGKTASHLLKEVDSTLTEFNNSLTNYNLKMELVKERTKKLKDEIYKIESDKAIPEIHLNYAKTIEEKNHYGDIVKEFDTQIAQLESKIEDVEKECELEIAMKQTV